MSAQLAVRDLQGGYDRLVVLRNVNLHLAKHRTLGILGPNGAGKSTLLKSIAGLLPTFGGTVELDGKVLDGRSAFARARVGLALVPEGRQILTQLSVFENLELAIAAKRLEPQPFKARLDDMLDLFPRLRERLRQPGGALSGGEQQMLAIARALLLDPSVLMLDEPTQGLAPIMVKQVLSALQGLKGRISMLIVEQNKTFLQDLADDVLPMRGGRLADIQGADV